MSIDLSGRVCVVTGAGQGIGRGIVEGFIQRGATVVATDLTAPSIPGAALALPWDVADPAAADRAIAAVVAKFGKLDALVANAGIYPRQPIDQITPERWDKVIGVNLDGTWHAARAAAAAMKPRRYGKIVTVTSITVVATQPNLAHYITAKAGVIGLTRAMAREIGRDGIRINAVMPGAIRTEGELRDFPDQAAIAKAVDEKQCIPGRIDPPMIEPSFAFLCSAESDAITGQVLCVDHGLTNW